jgi:hypothetical protein
LALLATRVTVSATVVPDCLLRVDGKVVKVSCTKGSTSAQITVRDGASNGVVADAKNVSAVTLERLDNDGDYVATIDL